MLNWNKISLFKFQQIQAINAKVDMDELDKLLFSVCAVFGFTEYQLDNMGIGKASKFIKKTERIFSHPLGQAVKKMIGRYRMNYDFNKLTFGQYVELAFFLMKDHQNPILNAHYSLASIARPLFGRYKTEGHAKRAEYFLNSSIRDIVGSLAKLLEQFKKFNEEHRSLFNLDQEVHGKMVEDSFNKRYGWTFSAHQVAEYERITLDEAYRLPARQAMNDLMYLKEKASYEDRMYKMSKK